MTGSQAGEHGDTPWCALGARLGLDGLQPCSRTPAPGSNRQPVAVPTGAPPAAALGCSAAGSAGPPGDACRNARPRNARSACPVCTEPKARAKQQASAAARCGGYCCGPMALPGIPARREMRSGHPAGAAPGADHTCKECSPPLAAAPSRRESPQQPLRAQTGPPPCTTCSSSASGGFRSPPACAGPPYPDALRCLQASCC